MPNPAAPEARDGRAVDITGKTVIITGANSGVGFAVAKELVRRGANVIMACRSSARGEQARQAIIDALQDTVPTASKQVTVAILDVGRLASVHEFAKKYEQDHPHRKIDLLYLNAGIAGIGRNDPTLTPEGFEAFYATNFLGHFLLLYLLHSRLAEDARVISTSSFGGIIASFSKTFSPTAVKGQVEGGFHFAPRVKPMPTGSNESGYAQTKAMQVLMTRALNQRIAANGSRRIALAYHPGLVSTNIFAVAKEAGWFTFLTFLTLCNWLLGISPEVAARTPVFLGTATEAALAQRGDRSKIWERSKSYSSIFDKPAVERFWQRWCADADITADWSL
ncbi:hypothetical protein OC834_003633 [Tilletia horrida]|nr:hypothetical protein OC834_003633 [Tilletia horrida]